MCKSEDVSESIFMKVWGSFVIVYATKQNFIVCVGVCVCVVTGTFAGINRNNAACACVRACVCCCKLASWTMMRS